MGWCNMADFERPAMINGDLWIGSITKAEAELLTMKIEEVGGDCYLPRPQRMGFDGSEEWAAVVAIGSGITVAVCAVISTFVKRTKTVTISLFRDGEFVEIEATGELDSLLIQSDSDSTSESKTRPKHSKKSSRRKPRKKK